MLVWVSFWGIILTREGWGHRKSSKCWVLEEKCTIRAKTREKCAKNAKNRLLALVCAPKNLDLVLIGRKVARFTHTYSLYSSLIKCFNKSD